MSTSSVAALLLLLPGAALPPAAAAAQAPRRGIPAGTYTTTLTTADVTGRVKEVPTDSMVGTWTLMIDSAGHFTVQRNGHQLVAGVARPRPGHRVYFDTTETGPGACHTPATYRYAVRGDSLTLRKVSDKCDPRIAVLTSHPHTRGS